MQRQDGGRQETGKKPSFRLQGPDKVQAWGVFLLLLSRSAGGPLLRVYTQNITLRAPFWTTVREEADVAVSTGAQWLLTTPRGRRPDCGPDGRKRPILLPYRLFPVPTYATTGDMPSQGGRWHTQEGWSSGTSSPGRKAERHTPQRGQLVHGHTGCPSGRGQLVNSRRCSRKQAGATICKTLEDNTFRSLNLALQKWKLRNSEK